MREPDVPDQPADAPSNVEHELINALASIVGFSQLIRRDPALPEDLRRNADLLVQEATRTRRLVQDLLDRVHARPPGPEPTTIGTPNDRVPDAEPASATAIARPRVLVLDDEPSMRVFLEKALALLGYAPVITSLGPEAVGRATDGDFAALLFDHQMPGTSGIQACEAVVAARPDLARRLVLMSGDVLDPGLEAFAATHQVTVLAKPFDLDTLDGTIRAVMAATGQVRG